MRIGESGPHYHDLPDDGANFKCHDCKKEGHASNFWVTYCPNGSRQVLGKVEFCDCIDPGWLSRAKYRGMFHDGDD